MIKLNPASRSPIFDQIKLGMKGLVKKGLLRPGDPAPSIRKMASDLKVNPNTVARAYRELSFEGFFEASRGQENIIAPSAEAIALAAEKTAYETMETAVLAARDGGFTWKEIEAMVETIKRRHQ